jgi:hypothetical protein
MAEAASGPRGLPLRRLQSRVRGFPSPGSWTVSWPTSTWGRTSRTRMEGIYSATGRLGFRVGHRAAGVERSRDIFRRPFMNSLRWPQGVAATISFK